MATEVAPRRPERTAPARARRALVVLAVGGRPGEAEEVVQQIVEVLDGRAGELLDVLLDLIGRPLTALEREYPTVGPRSEKRPARLDGVSSGAPGDPIRTLSPSPLRVLCVDPGPPKCGPGVVKAPVVS
jgi:hypothetical protein